MIGKGVVGICVAKCEVCKSPVKDWKYEDAPVTRENGLQRVVYPGRIVNL